MATSCDIEREEPPGKHLAVLAESLFLVNLLVLPGIAFLVILRLWFKHKLDAPTLARSHLRQVFYTSLRGGLLVAAAGIALLLPWLSEGAKWVVLIMYFTCVHSVLVCFGIIGLAKAMAGSEFRYPLLGPSVS